MNFKGAARCRTSDVARAQWIRHNRSQLATGMCKRHLISWHTDTSKPCPKIILILQSLVLDSYLAKSLAPFLLFWFAWLSFGWPQVPGLIVKVNPAVMFRYPPDMCLFVLHGESRGCVLKRFHSFKRQNCFRPSEWNNCVNKHPKQNNGLLFSFEFVSM